MRDKDVRIAIKEALENSDGFNAVVLSGLPEDYGAAAGSLMFAVVEPDTTIQEDWADATDTIQLRVTSRVQVTLMARDDDPQKRDEMAELLLDTAINSIQGQSLAGLTLPDLTRFVSAKWQKAVVPERRIVTIFTYMYLIEGWGNYDTND